MTAISDDDVFTAAPSGPPNGGAGSSTLMRGYLGEVNNRVRFLYNRLLKTFLGTPTSFAAGAVDTGTDRITLTSHGYATNDVLRYANVGGTALSIAGVALPLSEGLYGAALYARVVDANTIELASSSGGAALNITAAGSGTHYFFKVPSTAASALVNGFATVDSKTIPAGTLPAILAAYYLTRLGGTITGKLTASDTARWIKRPTLSLPDSNSTFGPEDSDVYYQTTPTAQRDHEVDGGDNEEEVEVRRGAAGNFAIVLHRLGSAAAIVTLPALTCCSVRLKKIGGVWTLLSYSGACTPGADAG